MEVFELLNEEHRVIKRTLNLLENSCGKLMVGHDHARDPMFQATSFLLQFAVECHQGKEDEILFPMLDRHGLAVDVLQVVDWSRG
jgi:hemerythrin-like domain-containing protein